MKVLFVFSTGVFEGSVAAVWANLLQGLPSRGVEPYVVVPQKPGERLASILEKLNAPCCEVPFTCWFEEEKRPSTVFSHLRHKSLRALNAKGEAEIGRFIDRHGIDLVYICDGTIIAGLKAAKERDLPVVWHIHEFIREQTPDVKIVDRDTSVGVMLARADRIITAGKCIKTDLRSRFPVLHNMVSAYNGVPLWSIADKGEILMNDEVVFTLVGRFRENNRQLDAVRAFIRIAPEYPEARLRLVGSGDDGLRGYIEDVAKRSKAASQIEFYGQSEDIARIWLETDVALNCAYTKGCSIGISEAMSNGCLVLCSTAEGNVELLEGGRGLLFERAKVSALSARMEWVMENREEARALASYGRKFAQRAFDLDRQLDAVYEVFDQLFD